MILKNLKLTFFKNHSNSFFEFGDNINCFLGKNGVGKTNLIDAIYYLSFTKSAVGSSDRLAITHNEISFTLFGKYENFTVAIQYSKNNAKILKIDGQAQGKMSNVIGKIPLVVMLPDDTFMIREGGEDRRKFFDGALSQFDSDYLQSLQKYTKLLKQRNSFLKQQEGKKNISQLLEIYDDQLIPLSIKLSKRRKEIVKIFLPFLIKNYADLHDGNETPDIKFKTQVSDSFATIFRANIQKDQLMQRTLLGSHRDDFDFLLEGELIKKYGSQGQQKTFLISLKLALYDFLKSQTGKTPILLLDDIFDKLDDSRIKLLVSLLQDTDRFQQIFIADARKDRSKEFFKKNKIKILDI